MTKAQSFGVTIVGGAVTGVTLALALKKRCPTLTVALIERQDLHQPQTQGGFDARVIALNLHSLSVLEQGGLWPNIADVGCPIETIHVSDRGHCGMVRLSPQPGQKYHGMVVALADVQQVLVPLLRACGVSCFAPAKITRLEATADGHYLDFADGSRCHTHLLVGADGTDSLVAQHLGLTAECIALEQSAIIANIVCQQPHHGCAFERFTSQGPVALLPMLETTAALPFSRARLQQGTPGQMSLVWCLPPEQALAMQAVSEAEFLTALQQCFGWRLGRLLRVGERYCYPLNHFHQNMVVGHHGVLVGNAAQTLHPIAGQGFNLGLRDVDALARVIAVSPAALGSAAMLADYQAKRQKDRHQFFNHTLGLLQLFRQINWPGVVGRQLGLMSAAHCALFRERIQQIGQGLKACL